MCKDGRADGSLKVKDSDGRSLPLKRPCMNGSDIEHFEYGPKWLTPVLRIWGFPNWDGDLA